MNTPLTTVPTESSRAQKIVQVLFDIFLRLLAFAFFVFTLKTWLTAVGYWPGAEFRFDTMSTVGKIYTAVLVVLHPVASVGLWSTLPWGRVVWFLAVGFQTLAIMNYGDAVQAGYTVVLFHLTCLGIYVIFQLLLNFINKER